MKIARRNRPLPLVPINAMADIAFLLLIFIMLLSLLNRPAEPAIAYPEARTAEAGVAGPVVTVAVDSTGRLFLDGAPASLAEVEGLLTARIAAEPSLRVEILADRETEYGEVDRLMRILQKLQHRSVTLLAGEVEEGE